MVFKKCGADSTYFQGEPPGIKQGVIICNLKYLYLRMIAESIKICPENPSQLSLKANHYDILGIQYFYLFIFMYEF